MMKRLNGKGTYDIARNFIDPPIGKESSEDMQPAVLL